MLSRGCRKKGIQGRDCFARERTVVCSIFRLTSFLLLGWKKNSSECNYMEAWATISGITLLLWPFTRNGDFRPHQWGVISTKIAWRMVCKNKRGVS